MSFLAKVTGPPWSFAGKSSDAYYVRWAPYASDPTPEEVRNPGRDSSLCCYIASGMFASSSYQAVPVAYYLGTIAALLKAVCKGFCAIS